MNKSLRIKVNPGEEVNKYIKVKIDQDVDTLEILSLKIGQTDIYSSFNANYGVLIGRVLGNNSVGIPNAKISVFIPITEEDKLRPEILAIYPFETVRDKDQEGRKYNLLPRVSVNNPFLLPGEYSPIVPVGSFPTKEEIYSNPAFLEVYEKYYKFTTVTNNSGDYMIYGVPIGTYDVHMSIDVTDIGTYSMTPATMVTQLGYSANLFSSNKIKFSTDLDTLPNIELQTASVNIRPFWGDADNYEIGITRQDFKIRTTLASPTVTIFGAGFTDHKYAAWGRDDLVGADPKDSISAMGINRQLEAEGISREDGIKFNTGIESKRLGQFKIEVYTIPNRVLMEDILSGDFDTTSDIVLLDTSQYSEILDDGMFILTIPCNRDKKIISENGELVATTDDNPVGIFTKFVGMVIIDYGPELTMEPENKSRSERNRTDRGRIKIPQYAPEPNVIHDFFTFETSESFSTERAGTIIGKTQEERIELNEIWRKQAFTFDGGKLYSVAKFNGAAYEDIHEGVSEWHYSTTGTTTNKTRNSWRNAGGLPVITSDDALQGLSTNATPPYQQGSNNLTVSSFVGEWMNMCIYFPQVYNTSTLENLDVSRMLTTDVYDNTDMTIENSYKVVGTRTDLSYFLRSDLHQATFIEVPKEDVINILQNAPTSKGFKSTEPPFDSVPLIGSYKSTGSVKYFYRGIYSADCIAFLERNGIINI